MAPTHDPDRPAAFPFLPTVIVLASAIVPVFYLPLRAVGIGPIGAGVAAGTVFAVLAAVAWVRSARQVGGQRLARLIWIMLAGACGVQLADLSVFMLDVERLDHAITPPLRKLGDPSMDRPFTKHNCFTCYVIATHLAASEPEDLYAKRYRGTEEPTPIHDLIGTAVDIDTYQYPPQFLVLPYALTFGGLDFFQQRTLWFALNVCLLVITFLAVVAFVDGGRFGPLWLLWPAVMCAPTTQLSLQMGNVHLVIVCLCVLAMLLIIRGWSAAGGVVLGYAICAKVFPGVLLVVLLCARRWRAALWTMAAMGGWTALTYGLFGATPFKVFVADHMPRLASGEAFSFAFTFAKAIVVNSSIMGIPYKFRELGLLDGDAAGSIARLALNIYTIGLLGLLVVCGVRMSARTLGDRAMRLFHVQLILTVIILGQLRSPFLPWPYGHFAVLLLIPVVAAGLSLGRSLWLVVLWAALAGHMPLGFGPPTPRFDIVFTLIAQTGVVMLCLWTVFRRAPRTLAPES